MAWFKSYLSELHQFVAVNEEVFLWLSGRALRLQKRCDHKPEL